MPLPLIAPLLPYLAAAGAGIVGWKLWERRPKMTPQRTAIYNEAMHSLKDPEKLSSLAAVFEGEGLSKQADMLRKRAQLRSAPDELKQARRRAFKNAMRSTDAAYVERIAKAHADEGATGAAERLYTRAKALRTS
jgi:hypothetical protein